MSAYFVEIHRESLSEELLPFGTRAELRALLRGYNIAAETESPDETELYGPGVQVFLPPTEEDRIVQFEIFEDDLDISKKVLVNLAKTQNWDFIDRDTDRRMHIYRPADADEEDDR